MISRIRRAACWLILLIPCLFFAAVLYINSKNRVLTAVPTAVPQSIPDRAPVISNDISTSSSNAPSVTPEIAPAVSPETAQTVTPPEISPVIIPEISPTVVPEIVPDTFPETTPDTFPEVLPDTFPETTQDTLSDVIPESVPVSAENWGLSFPVEGETPVGNASQDDLSQFDAFFHGDTSRKVIYLTFDCGYENGNTGAILDALGKHHAPGAFFVVGNMLQTAPEMVLRMVQEGHTVGNHTFHHPDMSAIADIESFEHELAATEDLYREITGQELSRYYRPPQGKYSRENLKQAQSLGYKTIFWSLAYVDWYQDNQPTREQAFAKLLPRIHNGAIVLLHSTSSTNAQILDELLTRWEEEGFTFGSLDELGTAGTSPGMEPETHDAAA